MTNASIQLERGRFYGKWLLLAFVLGLVVASSIGPDARWLSFAGWALLCGIAARRGHLLAWTLLCLTPLALMSALWLDYLDSEDPFGLRVGIIEGFTAACLVTGMTGILALLRDDSSVPHRAPA